MITPEEGPYLAGCCLTNDTCPAVPDPRTQKFYRSFVAKFQFAASWIRFDISFTVSQLAGSVHLQALRNGLLYTT
jgi:hypothetical protein